MSKVGNVYEIHQKKVWEVYAYDEEEALYLVSNNVGFVMEEEMFIDKTSEAVHD